MKILFWILSSVFLLTISNQIQAQNGYKGIALGSEKTLSSNESFEQQVLDLINIERKKRNLTPFVLDAKLTQAARYHAKDMAEENYFEHNSYDKQNSRLVSICSSSQRVKKFTTQYTKYAENIAAGQKTPQVVVTTWMNSSGHRKNILNPKLTYIGIGFIKTTNSKYQYYWVQNFGGK